MLLRTVAPLGMLAALAAGCSGPAPVCQGDCSLPIELAPVGLRDGVVIPLTAETVVGIQPPIQGGYVSYVGVRAKHVHDIGGHLTVGLRHLDTNAVVSLEERPVTLRLQADGWAGPEVPTQDLANLPVCEAIPGPDDFDRMAWQAELTFVDSDGRRATAQIAIRPECEAGDTYCHCSCRFDQTTACP